MSAARVAVNGVELAYEDRGGPGRPLVLVHGYTGSRRDFAARLPELARLGRTIALDLRGHGESSHAEPETYTLARLADDLVGFLAAHRIERCDLLGHSLGGMVALRAALAHPERFASLVLMNTAARAPDGIPLETFRLARRIALESGMATLVDLMRERAPGDSGRTEADRRLEAEWGAAYWEEWRIPNFRAMDPEAYAALGREIVEQPSLLARLAAIRCPTLVMVGEGDHGFLTAAEELERGIPGARRVEIPRAGHQPQLENSSAWLAAIREHLAQVRREPSFPGR